MEIRYTATPADVRAQLRYHLRHSRRAWLPFAFVVLCPVVFGVLPHVLGGSRIGPVDVLTALGIGMLAAVLLAVWAPRRVKRDERTLAVSPAGIRTSIGRLHAEVPWSHVALVGVTEEHVFVMGRSTNGFVIPRRAFGSADERAAFVQLVQDYHARLRHHDQRAVG